MIERLRSIWSSLQHHARYQRTWGTAVGRDCIDLDISLAKWLGERMTFMAKNTNSHPINYADGDAWSDDLKRHGRALLQYAAPHKETSDADDEVNRNAQAAVYFVAQQLPHLSD